MSQPPEQRPTPTSEVGNEQRRPNLLPPAPPAHPEGAAPRNPTPPPMGHALHPHPGSGPGTPPPHGPWAPPTAPPIPPEPDPKQLRPRTRWYWIGGSLLPAASIFSIAVNVLDEWFTMPDWMSVFSPLLLVLSFFATTVALFTVFALRTGEMSRLRAARARALQAAHYAHYARFAPPGFPTGPPLPYFQPQVPTIPAKDRRPRRLWFAAALLAPPALVGIGLLVLTLAGANAFMDSEPPELVSEPIEGGESTTLTVRSEDMPSLGLYSSPRSTDPGRCLIEGPGSPRLTEREVAHSWDEWRLEYSVQVDVPGEYTLTCGGYSDQSYVIAETRTAVKDDDHGFATFLTIMLSSFLGILAMIGAIVTVGIQRATYPERMARRRYRTHQSR